MKSKSEKGKMSMSDAGKLGAIAAKEIQRRKRLERRKEYLKNPSKCKFCEEISIYEKKKYTFCSHSCKAKYMNKEIKGNHLKPINHCLFCSNEMKSEKFCSHKCQWEFKWLKSKEYLEKNGEWENVSSDTHIRQMFKRLLLEKRGCKCEICNST